LGKILTDLPRADRGTAWMDWEWAVTLAWGARPMDTQGRFTRFTRCALNERGVSEGHRGSPRSRRILCGAGKLRLRKILAGICCSRKTRAGSWKRRRCLCDCLVRRKGDDLVFAGALGAVMEYMTRLFFFPRRSSLKFATGGSGLREKISRRKDEQAPRDDRSYVRFLPVPTRVCRGRHITTGRV